MNGSRIWNSPHDNVFHAFSLTLARLSFATCVALLSSVTLAQNVAPPKQPPLDVNAERQKYYDTIDNTRDQVTQNYQLRHDADGNVIKDSQWEMARADYDRAKNAESQRMKSDTRRDDELDRLFEYADMPGGPKGSVDTGASRSDKDVYGGLFSDRDLTVESSKQVNDIVDAARRRGYTIEPGQDYIRIKELDVVVWNGETVKIRPGVTIDPVTLQVTANDEVITQRRPFSATSQVERLRDAEVVLDPKSPGVSQQIKKAEADLRRPVPTDTRSQHEMVTNLGKAGYKSADGVAKAGATDVIPVEQRDRLKAIKSRTITADDVADPLDKPIARNRKLNDYKAEIETVLVKSLQAERTQRSAEAKRLKDEVADLRKRLAAATDAAEQTRIKQEIKQRHDASEALHQRQIADDMTLHVVGKKNPRVRNNVIAAADTADPNNPRRTRTATNPDIEPDTPSGPKKPGKLTTRLLFGVTAIGKLLGIRQAFEQESADSARQGRTYSQARVTVNIASNLSGVTDAINAIEGFQHETGEGMQQFIRDEFRKARELGLDPAKLPWLQESIYKRAVVRATGRATYQAVKGIPLIGDAVSQAENAVLVGESLVGLGVDNWKSFWQEQAARGEFKDQADRTIGHLEQLRNELRAHVQNVLADVRQAEELTAAQQNATTLVETLEERVRQLLTKMRETAAVASEKPSPIAANKLSEIEPYMQSVTKLANGFVRDADEVLRQFAADEISADDLFGRRGVFTRRMQAIDMDYEDASRRLETARGEFGRLSAASDLVSLRQAILIELQTVRNTLKSLEDLANFRASIQQHFTDQKQQFEAKKKILLQIYDGPLYRNAPDAHKETMRFIRAQVLTFRLPQEVMDAQTVQGRELQLARDRLRLFLGQVENSAKELGVFAASTSVEMETADAWNRVLAAADEMERAVADARDRMRRLRDAAPGEPPAFDLRTKSVGAKSVQFEFTALRLPTGKKKLVFNWNFGDGVSDVSGDRVRRHDYARDGRYEASVTVYEEAEKASLRIGEATAVVTIGSPDLPPPAVRGTGQLVGNLRVGTAVDLDGRRRIPGDTTGMPVLRFNAGDVHDYVSLLLYLDPRTRQMRCEIEGTIKIFTCKGWELAHINDLPYYTVKFTSQGTGDWNPASGEFRVNVSGEGKGTFETIKMAKGFGGALDEVKYSAEETQAAAAFVRQLGYDVSSQAWNGTVHGRLDWLQHGGGQGRIEINRLVQADWKLEPGLAYSVILPDELKVIAGQPRHVMLTQYPNEAAASNFLRSPRYRPVMPEFTDIGDEIREVHVGASPPRFLIRLGRFLVEPHGVSRGTSRQDLEQFVKRMRAFVESRE